MDVRTELQLRGFVKAGAIRPVDSGKSCKADIKLEVRGTAVYGLVVGDQFKKCGDTGRKNAPLKKRMTDCSRAINLVISGAIPGPFTENFKRLAPKAIESNQEIEVWVRESTATECKSLQRDLNGKFDTIWYGWANRLEEDWLSYVPRVCRVADARPCGESVTRRRRGYARLQHRWLGNGRRYSRRPFSSARA